MAQSNPAAALANIYRTPELWQKIVFTFLCLLIYRVGAHVTAPGVDVQALTDYFTSQRGGGGLLGLLAGPFGAAMGAAAGAMSGGWFDLNRAGERERFGECVAVKLKEGRTALLAELVEPDAATKSSIREQMTSLGGAPV